MKAVIMAGGKGTRLRPLTCDKPKPMVPIMNEPMMAHIVRLLTRYNIKQVAVTMCYLPEVIKNYFQDGSKFGVDCHYFVEETPLGTAGSVKNASQFLDDTFIVISGDALTDIDLAKAVAFHRSRGAVATLVLTQVTNPLEYGVVITDAEGRIKRFLEKPSWGEVFSDTVNTGIYILEPEVLKLIAAGEQFDFSKDLFPLLLAKGAPLYGYVAPGYWSDIGNLAQYRQAHYDALAGKVALTIPGRCETGQIWVEEGAHIDPGAQLQGPLLIGAYSQIKKGAQIAPYTVIGAHVVIGEGSSLKRSILWNNIFIDKQVELRGAVICNHSRLRTGACAYEGAVIGEECALGRYSIIKPEVKLWPGKVVDNQVTVGSSLVWGTRWSKALFGELGVTGLANVDITPEVAAKLGAAWGATLTPGATVCVGQDEQNASRMLKRALVAGVLSAGVNVYDLGTQTTPVVRFATASLQVAGGIQVRALPGDPSAVLFEFLDERGLNISKAKERELENTLFREDFRRSAPFSIGTLSFVPQLQTDYLKEVKELVTVPKEKELTVIVAAGGELITELLATLLPQLGCELRSLGAPGGGQKALSEALSAEVLSARAHLGVYVDANGERLQVVDETGRMIAEDLLLALLALIALRRRHGTTIPIPVTAPSAFEHLANLYQGKVIRTKANPRAWMEKAIEEKLLIGRNGLPFFPIYDALAALAQIIALVQEEGSLARVVAQLPNSYTSKREVPCGWAEKGRVMRELYAQAQGEETEFLDGIKIHTTSGWALVLPDAQEPLFQVYSEATSQEEADALSMAYAEKIFKLQ